MKRNKSIIQKDMSKCWVCGATQGLHVHEACYGTANRKKSIQFGLYVSLCGKHHNLSNDGIHFNKSLDLKLKREAQKKFEEMHGEGSFLRAFGRNYNE